MIAKWKTFSKEEIYTFYEESNNWTDFFVKMGYKAANDYGYTKKQLQKVYPDISFSHSKWRPGKKIGKLTLIEEVGRTERGLVIWKCRCDCGNIIEKSTHHLDEKSQCQECGKEIRIKKKRRDLTAQTFNYLTPIQCVGNIYGNGNRWICKCEICGQLTKPILTANITSGKVKSCGCLKSLGENRVKEVLNELEISYVQEYSFIDLIGDKKPLRFDFAIFNKNNDLLCLIECQGEQHNYPIKNFGGEEAFNRLKRYDALKAEYCKNKRISLFYIPQKDYKKINKEYLLKIFDKVENIEMPVIKIVGEDEEK